MPMVRGSLPSLIQGISQQSPDLRPKAYLADAVNVYPSTILGLDRRAGADHVANIGGIGTNPVDYHWIERDAVERYLVVAGDTGTGPELHVRDLAGNVKTVNAPDGWGYMVAAFGAATPSIGFTTVNDYTFVYDRNRTVAMTATVQPTPTPSAHIWIRQGDYATNYKVRVGYPVSSPTWTELTSTTSPTDVTDIKTSAIATDIRTALAGLPGGLTDWALGGDKHVVYIARTDGADFLVETHDDATGKNIVTVKGSVSNVTDLPSHAVNGTIIRVTGNKANERDDYWVTFVGIDTFSEGFWKECPAPGTPLEFNAATMPHVLVREGDGTFTFREADWAQRVSGGETYNPRPSFVGKQVKHVGAHKGRIAFTGEGFYTATRARDLFHFWQQSVLALEDSDPIDVSPSYPKVYTLKGSVEFQRGLILFADNVQFVMRSGDVFGPKTVSADPLSEYSLDVENGLLGLQQDRIMATVKRDNVVGLMAFKAASANAGDIVFDEASAVVPSLIKGNAQWITGSSTENVVALRPTGSNRLYVYKEASDGGKIIQSSWVSWEFANRVPVSGFFFGPNLYLLLRDTANAFTIERISLLPLITDQLPWDICLDRRSSITSAAFATNGAGTKTIITLPFTVTVGEKVFMVLTAGAMVGHVAQAEPHISQTNTVTFPGLITAANAEVGVGARSRATLSTIYFRRPTQGGGEEVVTTGTLQLTRGYISYAQSGPFAAEIKPHDRPSAFVEPVAVPRYEDGGFLSPESIQTGTGSFPIGALNDKVTITFDSGDQPMPMRLGTVEWIGELNMEARPV